MNVINGLALVIGLATPLAPFVTGASAETATEAKPAATDTKAPMSDADKRARAVECSKQADAKKLHGEARKTFREACKRK